jgi:sulfite exporter TauE/SafE
MRIPLGSDIDDLAILAYLLLGALFAIIASLSFRRAGFRLLTATTVLTSVVLLVLGLWEESTVRRSETSIGLPILLAFVAPILTALVIQWVGRNKSTLPAQWILAWIVWVVSLVPVGITALFLNWITF